MHYSSLAVLFTLFQLGTTFQHQFYRVIGNFAGSVIGMAQHPSLASCGSNCQTGCGYFQYFSYNKTCVLFRDVNITLADSDKAMAPVPVSFKKRACPDGWTQLLGSCYWLRLESSSWDEAAEVCTAMSGYLATITSQTEHDAIIGAYNSSVPNAIWIGGKYDEIEQRWNWINGEVWNYTNICSNCTFEASLNCINIKARDFDSLRFWNYRKCSVSKYALCEKEF